ncbi:hypothetical protein FRC17_009010 [Serendipita sp. 399]|nr:hypothetical protein FRC17_009010 [Serendipita sp. 399]
MASMSTISSHQAILSRTPLGNRTNERFPSRVPPLYKYRVNTSQNSKRDETYRSLRPPASIQGHIPRGNEEKDSFHKKVHPSPEAGVKRSSQGERLVNRRFENGELDGRLQVQGKANTTTGTSQKMYSLGVEGSPGGDSDSLERVDEDIASLLRAPETVHIGTGHLSTPLFIHLTPSISTQSTLTHLHHHSSQANKRRVARVDHRALFKPQASSSQRNTHLVSRISRMNQELPPFYPDGFGYGWYSESQREVALRYSGRPVIDYEEEYYHVELSVPDWAQFGHKKRRSLGRQTLY